MRTGKLVLMLGLAASLSACQQATGGGPLAAGVGGVDAPRFHIQATDTSAAEQGILDAINTERAANGLNPLTMSDSLSAIAREHAQDMVNRQYFNHTTPDGQGPYQRLLAAGVGFAAYGETSHFPDARGPSAVADWLRHPGGKRQMLDARFTMAGVGIAYSTAEQRYYVNVMYLRPNVADGY
jgi:uncharacterized protein YkwD